MNKIYPAKLQKGDKIAVIAPARSLSLIPDAIREISKKRFSDLGLELVFGNHVNESDEFKSTSIESRVEDLHWAFSNPEIKGIITVIGGFNSNQLLKYIDWEIIKNNPKVFCGFSDITALNNSIFAKTGLVNYSGPHYTTFGQELAFEYTLEYFQKTLMEENLLDILPSNQWSDDAWRKDQLNRNLINNEGFVVVNEGRAAGTVIGGNLSTLVLLNGTEFMPSLENTVLFLEDDDEVYPEMFDRMLQSLIHQKGFSGVKALVIGRFQKASNINAETIKSIINSKKELSNIPVICGVDFGHTDPKITLPIGGECEVSAENGIVSIKFTKH